MTKIAAISIALMCLVGCAQGDIRFYAQGSPRVAISESLGKERSTPMPTQPSMQLPESPSMDDWTPSAPKTEGIAIAVYKERRRLYLWQEGELLLGCSVGLGFSPEGDKKREGDGRTPEGEFYVCTRNAQSRFYLSLGLSYPNEEDAARGLESGLISKAEADEIEEAICEGKRPPWNTPLGGEIMIHGYGGDRDWTAGCVAVDDACMDVLWEYAKKGTPVWIYP